MKNDLLKLVRWFCLKLSYNDLASVVPMLHEVLTGSRKDIDLKPEEDRPPNYRQFQADLTLPLTQSPSPKEPRRNWQQIQKEHKEKTGKRNLSRVQTARRTAQPNLQVPHPATSRVQGFDEAVALTTLFVAYSNFMRPHGSLKKHSPVELNGLKDKPLHPDQWVELLRQAA